MSYSNFPNEIRIENYPESQLQSCQSSDMYKFVRERLGNKIVRQNGGNFGPYLYRNTRNNVLISSWEKPINKELLYTSCEIGMNADAVHYYKNE